MLRGRLGGSSAMAARQQPSSSRHQHAHQPATRPPPCSLLRHGRSSTVVPVAAASSSSGLRASAGAGAAAARRRRASSTTTSLASSSRKPLRVSALDAALPFDFEHRARAALESERKLTVGIVGFGTFGQFLARRLAAAGHRVLATSRGDYTREAAAIGAEFFRDADAFCEEHPEVVVLATSILSTERVLRSLPVQRLKRSTLFVDVLSVKAFPKQLLLRLLPPETDILCTHPMFGPDSGRGSWQGLNFMYERVRVNTDCEDGARREARADNFLRFFADEGCRMVEMPCEEHDRVAASTQFITHTVGRVLGAMDLKATPIDTKGFKALLELVDNTRHDSFELYYGLFLYNRSSADELERLERALDEVKGGLFDQLHEIARRQIFPPGSSGGGSGSDGDNTVVAELLPPVARRSMMASSDEDEDEEEEEGGRPRNGRNGSSNGGRALPGPGTTAEPRRLGDGATRR